MSLETIQKGELIYYAWTLSPKIKELLLVPISDIHWGNSLFSMSHLNKALDFIKNTRNAYAILNGDLIEAVTRDSKGDIFTQQDTPPNFDLPRLRERLARIFPAWIFTPCLE